MRWLIGIVMLAGCDGGGGAGCAHQFNHFDRPRGTPAEVATLIDHAINACNRDHWSNKMLECVSSSRDELGLDRCVATYMTPAQAASLAGP